MATIVNWLYHFVLLFFIYEGSTQLTHTIQQPIGSTRIIKNKIPQSIGSTHILRQNPIGSFGYPNGGIITNNNMFQAKPNQIKPFGYHAPTVLDPQLLMQFKHFLALLENNTLRIFDISPHLLEFFMHKPDLRNLIQMLHTSPFNVPISRGKIEAIQNFTFYIFKLIRKIAHIYDLNPEILSLIVRQEHWLEFFPPLPPGTTPEIITLFIMFINEVASLEFDLQKIPHNLKEFFINSPIGLLQYLVMQLTRNNRNINPDTILRLIQFLRNQQPHNISPQFKEILDEQNYKHNPILEMILDSTELKTFILEIINNKKLYNISPYILESFIRDPNLERQIKIILQKENVQPSKFLLQTIIQLINLIKQIQNKEPIEDIPITLLNIMLKLQGAEKLIPPMLTWIQDNKTLAMMNIFLDIVNSNSGREIPKNLRAWLSTLPTGKLMIDYLQIPGEVNCTPQPNDRVQCTKIISELSETIYPVQTQDSESENLNNNENINDK